MKVELANQPGTFVTVNREDFEFLRAQGVPARWLVNSNGAHQRYVRFTPPYGRGLETVARVILNAAPGQRLSYANGDPFDLRRRNLRLQGAARPIRLSAPKLEVALVA